MGGRTSRIKYLLSVSDQFGLCLVSVGSALKPRMKPTFLAECPALKHVAFGRSARFCKGFGVSVFLEFDREFEGRSPSLNRAQAWG